MVSSFVTFSPNIPSILVGGYSVHTVVVFSSTITLIILPLRLAKPEFHLSCPARCYSWDHLLPSLLQRHLPPPQLADELIKKKSSNNVRLKFTAKDLSPDAADSWWSGKSDKVMSKWSCPAEVTKYVEVWFCLLIWRLFFWFNITSFSTELSLGGS